MRAILSLLLSVAPAALWAAPAELPAKVTAVTLYPQGAEVTRVVTLTRGGEVLIPNLPDHTDSIGLRVSGQGLDIGAVTLIDGRQPAADLPESPDVVAARARVADLTAALARKSDAVDAIRAEAGAARARASFLRGASTQNTPPAELAKLAQTVSDGVLAAEKDAIAADARARDADLALAPDRAALDQAKQALQALEHPAKGSDALLLQASGPGTVTITTFAADAGWSPAYDLRLDDKAGKLAIDRYVTVHQASGEDWSGVDLTLSTARTTERSDPSQLSPQKVSSGPPMAATAAVPMRKFATADVAVSAPAPAPEAFASVAAPVMLGETVTYHFPAATDIRDGVEHLRLRLDTLTEPVKVIAQAVPRLDQTAFRMVEGSNDGTEPLLPGPASLFVDGAMVGASALPFVAAGDRFSLGFGAIDGLRLSRAIPQASEGDRGLISKSNARVEVAQISVENLTGRDWPMRLLDQVPYSEQDDLTVKWEADPAPTATDWEDKRGLLAWEFTLGSGKTQKIALTTTLNWPAGEELRP